VSSFLTAHQHIIRYLVRYNGESVVESLPCCVSMYVWQWGVVAGWHVYIWHPRHVRWKSLTGSQWWQSPRSVASTVYCCL